MIGGILLCRCKVALIDCEVNAMTQEDNNAVAATTRFPQSEFDAVENWRRAQRKIPPLAEALRVLVKRGLAATEDEREHAA